MPIYEYCCTACGYEFEKMQKITDQLVTICPQCSADQVTKLVSQSSFQLKGTGWYATDFKDQPKKASNVNNRDRQATNTETTAETT